MTDLDKSNINVLFQHIHKIEIPKMESEQGQQMAVMVSEGLEIIKQWILQQAKQIKNEQ